MAERSDRVPLSPVEDLIRSQSTKGLAFLQALGLKTTELGVWGGELEGIQVMTIEACPAACLGYALVAEPRSALTQQAESEHQDIQDSLTCALVGRLCETDRESLALGPNGISVREWWIWVPSDTLREPQPSR